MDYLDVILKAEELDCQGFYKKADIFDIRLARFVKLANEYWFKNGETEFADGEIGDYNHEQIAEDEIISNFIGNKLPDNDSEYKMSIQTLGELSTEDDDFLHFLEEKYNYTQEDAIDDADANNYICWLVTGDDTSEAPIIKQMYQALRDPRQYVIENYGWQRVQGNNIETRDITDGSLDNIVRCLYEIYEESCENMNFNIDCYHPRRFFGKVPFHEIDDHTIQNKLREIDDPFEVKRRMNPTIPQYKYEGG